MQVVTLYFMINLFIFQATFPLYPSIEKCPSIFLIGDVEFTSNHSLEK